MLIAVIVSLIALAQLVAGIRVLREHERRRLARSIRELEIATGLAEPSQRERAQAEARKLAGVFHDAVTQGTWQRATAAAAKRYTEGVRDA